MNRVDLGYASAWWCPNMARKGFKKRHDCRCTLELKKSEHCERRNKQYQQQEPSVNVIRRFDWGAFIQLRPIFNHAIRRQGDAWAALVRLWCVSNGRGWHCPFDEPSVDCRVNTVVSIDCVPLFQRSRNLLSVMSGSRFCWSAFYYGSCPSIPLRQIWSIFNSCNYKLLFEMLTLNSYAYYKKK